jgi:hypothetical protein
MSATIVLTSANVVPDGNNNSFVYNFPNSVTFPNHQIALQSATMYYSWDNISAALSNNTIIFNWRVGTTVTPVTITFPDGLYQIADLQSYIEQYCLLAQNYYLFNTVTGRNVFYFQIQVNPTAYAVQLNVYPVPTSLPTGFTAPASWGGYPSVAVCPVVTFPAQFNKIVGFTAGYTSPSGLLITSSFTSTIAPQVQPNPSVFIAVSNINNKYAVPSSIIYSVTPTNVAFGSQIKDQPPQFAWNKLLPGTYNQLRMTFLGANLQPLIMNDPNITILLAIRDTKDLGIADLVNQLSGGK